MIFLSSVIGLGVCEGARQGFGGLIGDYKFANKINRNCFHFKNAFNRSAICYCEYTVVLY